MVISNRRRLAIEKINAVVKWLIVKSGWGFHKGLSVAPSAKVGKWKKIKIKTRDCQFIVSSTLAKPNLLTFPEGSPASTPLLPTAGVKITKVPSQHHCHCFHTQLFCSVRVQRNTPVWGMRVCWGYHIPYGLILSNRTGAALTSRGSHYFTWGVPTGISSAEPETKLKFTEIHHTVLFSDVR